MRDAKKNLLAGLASLPKPKEYEAQAPEDIVMDGADHTPAVRKGTSAYVADVEDLIKQKRKELQNVRDAEMERRSQALKKELPRPFKVNAAMSKPLKVISEMPRKTDQERQDLAIELVKAELVSVC